MEREQTTIRLPVELKEKLQQEAEIRGYTIRDLIVVILWNYFRHHKEACRLPLC